MCWELKTSIPMIFLFVFILLLVVKLCSPSLYHKIDPLQEGFAPVNQVYNVSPYSANYVDERCKRSESVVDYTDKYHNNYCDFSGNGINPDSRVDLDNKLDCRYFDDQNIEYVINEDTWCNYDNPLTDRLKKLGPM